MARYPCWIYGQDAGAIFFVDIPNDEPVVPDIKHVIMNRQSASFEGVDDPDLLTLYSIPLPSHDDHDTVLGQWTFDGKRPLHPLSDVTELSGQLIIVRSPITTLNYWLYGDDTRHIYDTKVLRTKSVRILEETISKMYPSHFSGIDAGYDACLPTLYSIPMPAYEDRDTVLGHWTFDGKELLHPLSNVTELSGQLIVVRSPIITLNYWLYGDDTYNIYGTKILATKSVRILEETISKMHPSYFSGIDADYDACLSSLYSIPMPACEDRDTVLGHWTFDGKRPLIPLFNVTELSGQLIVVRSPILTISYCVYGDDTRRISNFKVLATKSVSRLKGIILKMHSHRFRGIDADQLCLHRVPIPFDTFKQDVETMEFDDFKSLDGVRALSYYFPNQPPKDCINIVVTSPHIVPQKRQLEENEIDQEKLKRAWLATMAPSSFSSSVYLKLQENQEQRVLDRRWPHGFDGEYLPDDNIPPIALVYQPFGEFLDTYLRQQQKHSSEEYLLRSRNEVDHFAVLMSHIYGSEEERRNLCLPALNRIFRSALGDVYPTTVPSAQGDAILDGYTFGTYGEPICMVQVKNEMLGGCIPIGELVAYYSRFTQTVSEKHPGIFNRSKLPALGITIVGPEITFYALTLLQRWHYTSLTHRLSCVEGAVGGNTRGDLHRAFAAASTLLGHIIQHSRTIIDKPQLPHEGRHFPEITELSSPHALRPPIKFQITGTLVKTAHRHLYLAKSEEGKRLVVKFATTYAPELHMHCAKQGHAPELHGFARMPGGIFGIAMDFVAKARNVGPEGSLEDQESWKRQLSELVTSFHDAGYVHGDLRFPNVLHVGNNIVLLDYDWGGKEGEASYPIGPLNPELTIGRVSTDPKITKNDDMRILSTTLGQIGHQYVPLL